MVEAEAESSSRTNFGKRKEKTFGRKPKPVVVTLTPDFSWDFLKFPDNFSVLISKGNENGPVFSGKRAVTTVFRKERTTWICISLLETTRKQPGLTGSRAHQPASPVSLCFAQKQAVRTKRRPDRGPYLLGENMHMFSLTPELPTLGSTCFLRPSHGYTRATTSGIDLFVCRKSRDSYRFPVS